MTSDTGLYGKNTISFVQSSGTNNFITFAFVGLEVITGLACAEILLLVNVEKTVHKKQQALIEREKLECGVGLKQYKKLKESKILSLEKEKRKRACLSIV